MYNEDDVLRKECRWVDYLGPSYNREGEVIDVHLVKENVILKDETTVSNINILTNFRRPFYVTDHEHRTYKQKKERESLEYLDVHYATQYELNKAVPKALGLKVRSAYEAKSSPYLYGFGVPTDSFIKHAYESKYGANESYYTVAGLDIETDVVRNTNEVIINSLYFKDRIYVYITEWFLDRYDNPLERLRVISDKLLQSKLKEGVTIEFFLCKDEAALLRESFLMLHSFDCDVVAIFNQFFDVPYIEKRCHANNIDPAELWCDPKIDEQYHRYEFKPGRTFSMTEDGKTFKIPIEQQWHWVTCTSSFEVYDPMCAYRLMRSQDAKLPAYSLDALSEKEGVGEKLKLEGCEGLKKLALHIKQQRDMPLEYCVYAGYDPYLTVMLDEKTMDLKLSLPASIGYAHGKWAATPSMTSDIDLHFWNIERGYALGTPSYVDKDDKEAVAEYKALNKTLSTKNWIITCDAYKTTLNGVACLKEAPQRITNIRLFGQDVDVTASYPSSYIAGNVSQETTVMEVIKFTGTRTGDFRRQNVNSLSGRVNALDYGIEMHGLPNPIEMIALIDALD